MKILSPQFFIIVLIACLGSLQSTHAVSPPPDGGYPGGNTAEGNAALLNLTTGGYNTAVGLFSLRALSSGNFNTAIGAGTLALNAGDENTATGAGALLFNTANGNTANGGFALFYNTAGLANTAQGDRALFNNNMGNFNTATGFAALFNNIDAVGNTANGASALQSTTTGGANTAVGSNALFSNTSGFFNTAVGGNALYGSNGIGNIAIGYQAGDQISGNASYNIYIGNRGDPADDAVMRIGSELETVTFIAGVRGVPVTGAPVLISAQDQLGVASSSARFKKDIKPMDKASEALLALKPVTFRYNEKIDPDGTSQFGLVAEDVEKVNPDLVVRDKEGRPFTVRYDAVNAMLLNEFLKAHRLMEEQNKRIEELTAQLKRQAAQIQKVSAQLEVSKPAPQTALNNQ